MLQIIVRKNLKRRYKMPQSDNIQTGPDKTKPEAFQAKPVNTAGNIKVGTQSGAATGQLKTNQR